jgi:hypothetical protein
MAVAGRGVGERPKVRFPSLNPTISLAHELADGEGIEELVGHNQERTVADLVEIADPLRLVRLKAGVLFGDQRRIGFEQP